MLWLTLLAPPAWSCSLVVPGEFVLDDASDDDVPPEATGPVSVRVTRGRAGTAFDDGSCAQSSCDDIGQIGLSFAPAWDDRSPDPGDTDDGLLQPAVGYLLTVEEGELPGGLTVPEAPQSAWLRDSEASMPLIWLDGASATQEAFAFTLRIEPIDLAGNLGPPTRAQVADPGASGPDPCDPQSVHGDPDADGDSGCQTAPAGGAVAATLALLLGLSRRRW